MTGRRLFRYALQLKKTLLSALLFLAIAVGCDVAAPFVAKTLIDRHILGVDGYWVKTDERKGAAFFEGDYYRKVRDPEGKGMEEGAATLLQIGKSFYFVPDQIPPEAKKQVKDGRLVVQAEGTEKTYPAEKLTAKEMMGFYRPEFPAIALFILGYFALFALSGLFHFGEYYFLQKTANRIIQRMRNEAFEKIQTLPISYFDSSPAGKIVARITNDTEAIRTLYVTVLSNFVNGFITLSGIYAAMFFLDKKLAAMFLAVIPVVFLWMILYRKFASRYNRAIRSKNSEINAMLNESIQGMAIIQAFNREKRQEEEFEKLNDAHFRYRNKLLSINSLSSHNLTGLIRGIVLFAFIWYFGFQSMHLDAAVTVGTLYAFVDYINRLFYPIGNIVNQFANLDQAMVAGERLFRLLDEKGEPLSDERIPRYRGNVRFEHVYFGYEDGKDILQDIDFEVRHGQTVALVGHTGSGKSSIVNLLFRFYDCKSGAIYVDGKDIRTIPRQALREHMAIVLQDPYLFKGTIYSNISLNDPRITKEDAARALKAVGGEGIFKHLAKGLDEPVNEKGSTLSAGERQLISFARALAFNPAILILDEATSNIDTETEAIIQRAMDVVKAGRTTFIIAHRLSTVKNADLILVLKRGRIVERGNHEELMAKKGIYYQLYKLQHHSQGG